jgi:uncharacterized repeat protein (TIGR01451 family)
MRTLFNLLCVLQLVALSSALYAQNTSNKPPVAETGYTQISFYNSADEDLNAKVYDPENELDTNSFVLIQAPKFCKASITHNGICTIFGSKPSVEDTLIYKVCDKQGLCTEGVLIIDVSSNSAPEILSDPYVVSKNYVHNNFFFIQDGNTNIAHDAISIVTPPTHGSFKWEVDSNGTWLRLVAFGYTPAKDYLGSDEITLKVCDTENECTESTLQFFVVTNNAPVAKWDTFHIKSDTLLLKGDVSLNDADSDNNMAADGFRLVTYPKLGNMDFNWAGHFEYTPTGEIGVDTIQYMVCDSLNICDTASILIFITNPININPKNNAPLAVDDYFSTVQNTPIGNSLRLNDTDADDNIKGYSTIKTMEHGVLNITLSGDFQYIPNNNFYGVDTAYYAVCDSTNLCDTAKLVISVRRLNHEPNLVDDVIKTKFNTTYEGSVALNDSDIDGNMDKTSYSVVTKPQNGTVKLWADGKFYYTPKHNFIGQDTFYYQAYDSLQLSNLAACIITVEGGIIRGRAFFDENKDGILNRNDYVLSNVVILVNTDFSVFTNAKGDYEIPVDTGKVYELHPVYALKNFKHQPYKKTIKTTNDLNQLIDNQDFAFTVVEGKVDLQTTLFQGNARPGYASASYINYSNNGTSILNGKIEMTLDKYLAFESADVKPDSIIGRTYIWNVTDLRPFEDKKIVLMLKTLVGAPLYANTTIEYNGKAADDIDLSNNEGVSNMPIKGSYDPNDIAVDKPTFVQTGSTIREPIVPLTYTIRFQNTGNAEALRVEVVDTIGEKLDIASLQMVAASHPFELKVMPDSSANYTIVKWVFDNINLLDSTTKEACSHGFITYRINNMIEKTHYDKDTILNKAAIYFDFNAPIFTNTARTIFSFMTPTPTRELENLSVHAYPNPTNDVVNIKLDAHYQGSIDLFETNGRLIDHQILRGDTATVNLKNLNTGMYIVRIKTDNGVKTIKVIKE